MACVSSRFASISATRWNYAMLASLMLRVYFVLKYTSPFRWCKEVTDATLKRHRL